MKSLSLKLSIGLIMPLLLLLSLTGVSQNCNNLNFTYVTTESRCIATGSIKVSITGGSGNYNVKVTGPVTTGFTSSSTITGLSAGSYTVTVKDITSGCVTDKYGVVVQGTYADPRFVLAKTDVTCMNGTDGTVSVSGLQNGRSPFKYTLVSPSPSHLGETNTTGVFTNLVAGEYAVELKDSCGGQQTRRITVLNYTWWIDGVTVSKVGCDSAKTTVKIKDSKGNLNTNASQFPGFKYGIVRAAGDTVWSTTSEFVFKLNHKRSVTVVIKDPCGTMQVQTWVDPNVPTVAANVTTSDVTCSSFTAKITGQNNLTSAAYELYNNSNVKIASNATGTFTNLAFGKYCIRVKDICYDTTIQRCFELYQPKPSVDGWVNIWNKACATFTAAITGNTNMTNPVYKLYNSSNVLISTSSNGIFDLLPYGSYCIKITDGCYDTTITRCFTETPPKPEIWGNIATSNASCSTYTAAIQGTSNLTNPVYCMYTGTTLVGCNSTGKFDNLAYGITYCIRVKNDVCYDTTIYRCIVFNKPVPSVGAVDQINKTCSTFTAKVKDINNLFDAEYCLYNASNVKVTCNNTGEFPGLAYGSYCIKIKSNAACYDTLITKCFTASRLIPSMNSVSISNRSCSTYTAKASGNNLTDPTYILYNASNVAIDSNKTGTFNNVVYGVYSIRIRNTCYDTVMTKPATDLQLKPEGGAVGISNKACSTFTATVSGQKNLYNATYKLYTASGTFVTSITSGSTFNNVSYGSYCIRITTPCYDTTISICFTVDPVPSDISVTAQESCTFGTTDLKVVFTSGTSPYTVQVLNPVGVLVTTVNSNSSPVIISGLAPLSNGQQYKVIGIEKCNGRDTAMVTPKPSILNKTNQVKSKCPSGVWENGATDISIDVSSNMGVVTPQIIKKNGAANTINFTSNVGTTYKFIDLEPATYIMAYSVPSCTGKVYDTIVVAPYSFPGLQQSAAYQCDNNNFSVGAAVTGGTSPFTFEIIGSIPDTPSIKSVAQTNPVFNITNGKSYSLVRLRAVDACGNATLNDVNILPLANTIVYATSDCYYDNITLSVDSISNATYSWYKKGTHNDSTLISSSQTYSIPYLLPSDTGTYISRISVNGGCLTKLSYFTVTGACSFLLPGQVRLSGKSVQGGVQLTWDALQDGDVVEYIVERSAASNLPYTAIGKITARAGAGRNMYAFTDDTPLGGMNYYRLRMVTKSQKEKYSNVAGVRMSVVSSISLFPNPVSTQLNISIAGRQTDSYKLSLVNAAGQIMHEQMVQNVQQTVVPYIRKSNMKSGVYMLHITALNSQETYVYKVIFK